MLGKVKPKLYIELDDAVHGNTDTYAIDARNLKLSVIASSASG